MIEKSDLESLLTADRHATRRLCKLVLKGQRAKDELLRWGHLLRISSLPRGEDRAALTIQYRWRKNRDAYALRTDPLCMALHEPPRRRRVAPPQQPRHHPPAPMAAVGSAAIAAAQGTPPGGSLALAARAAAPAPSDPFVSLQRAMAPASARASYQLRSSFADLGHGANGRGGSDPAAVVDAVRELLQPLAERLAAVEASNREIKNLVTATAQAQAQASSRSRR